MGSGTNPTLENLKPFEKGKSGNPKGRPKGSRGVSTVLRDMLEKAAPAAAADKDFLRAYCNAKKKITNADAVVARMLYEAIENGEAWAIKEINDRSEGKAKQGVELTGENGGPIQQRIVIEVVDDSDGGTTDQDQDQ